MVIPLPFFDIPWITQTLPAVALFQLSELTNRELMQRLIEIGSEVCASGEVSHQLQRKNARSLIRKVKILLGLFEFLRESSTADRLSSSARLCFREIHFLLVDWNDLLACCGNSSGIWILLHSEQFLTRFHNLNQDISASLDVLPLGDLALTEDLREQIELLKRQFRESELHVDPKNESLRKRIYAFVNDFEKGTTPDPSEIREIFADGLQIRDAAAFRREIEFLEEQTYLADEEVDLSLIHSVIALSRYSRFSLFGPDPTIHETPEANQPSPSSPPSTIVPPRDFCCPISLELMIDPVVVCTGQTYDRSSIAQWIEEGRCSCPYSGKPLKNLDLVPNRALSNLIKQWRTANDNNYGYLEEPCSRGWFSTRAAVEAHRATAELLVENLSCGRDSVKTAAAIELRYFAREANEIRASIAEAGAIPLLHCLLSSSNPIAQENSMAAILNLSVLEKNKSLIVEHVGCLKSIVAVMTNGKTVEARANAAATLSSLSMVHKHKKLICEEEGAVEALAMLLGTASRRAKKHSVIAMCYLCIDVGCWKRMVESGAAAVMIGALEDEAVAEEAADALKLLMSEATVVAVEVARMKGAVEGLVGLMREGTETGKENAAAALVVMCREGGTGVAKKVSRMPGMQRLLRRLYKTGSKRGRGMAAMLVRLCYCTQEKPSPMDL